LFLIQPETPTARAVWVMLDALDTLLGTEGHRIVHLKDVTERMSIYQDMRRFHTVVAHKLRTPMSLLVSSMSLLKSTHGSAFRTNSKNWCAAASKAWTGWLLRCSRS
jgi:hypothetical protein